MTLAKSSTMLSRGDTSNRIATLGAIGAAAATAFGVLTMFEGDHRLAKKDRKGLKKIAPRDDRKRRLAASLHPLGKWWAYVPVAAAAGAAVYWKGRGRPAERTAAAASIVLAAAVSAAVNPLFDKVLPQPPLPPRRKSQPKPTFPSGHTFGLGAVALTTAYIFEREGLIGRGAATPIALLPPLIGGTAKIVEEKHWPSEVAGGFLVGVAIASLSAIVYEVSRGERGSSPES